MPWSEEPLERESYESLVALPKERAEEYGNYLQVLREAKEDQGAWEFLDGAEFVEKLRALGLTQAISQRFCLMRQIF